MKVLLVDDDEEILKVIARMFLPDLAIMAGGVREAKVKALEAAFKGVPFDIVVADIDLGDGTGFDLARILRETERPPAFMFMSGYVTPGRKVEATELGGKLYDKFDLGELVRELKRRVR